MCSTEIARSFVLKKRSRKLKMVQVFMVIRCFSCKTFQVHQVKKSNKWVCKLCGEKQSVKKVFSEGTGAECRVCVQQLNLMRKEMENESLQEVGSNSNAEDVLGSHGSNNTVQELLNNKRKVQDDNAEQKSSRWKRFMSDECVNNDADDDDCEDMVVTTFRKAKNSWQPKKKRKIRDKVLVDAKLLQYPARKQQDGKKLSQHWSNAETVQHSPATSLHQSTQLSTVKSFPMVSPVQQNLSLYSSNSDTELLHSDVKLNDTGKNSTVASDTTIQFDGDFKTKSDKISKKKVTSANSNQSNRHIPAQQSNQVKTSKWKKFMVDPDPNIDEAETECYHNNIPETDNVMFGSLNVNNSIGFPRDAKVIDSVSAKTQRFSNSSCQIPEKVPLCQNKSPAKLISYKLENQNLFQLDETELEDEWWKV